MSEFITHTARIVPYTKRPRQVASFVTAYTNEPMPDDPGADLGNFFVVLEVLVSGRAGEELADLIIGTLGEHYYNHADGEPLARFETALKALNRELGTYVSQGNASWIGKLSAIAGIQAGAELHLTHTGSAEAFLYRGKATTPITSSTDKTRSATPTKTFASIASGTLEAGDRLLLATPALVHQLPLQKLHDIIISNSPNNAIAEIGRLLNTSADRIAALVVEITTPELAAMQVRSEAPDEVRLGTPENTLEAAKLAAAPLAEATTKSTKQVGQAAQKLWSRTKPTLQHVGLAIVSTLRRFLTGKGSGRRIIIVLVTLIVVVGGFWAWQNSDSQVQKLYDRYRTDYERYQLAASSSPSSSTNPKSLLEQTLQDLTSLSQSPGAGSLNRKLQHSDLPAGSPSSISTLTSLVKTKLDQLEGLSHPATTTVASLSKLKDASPNHAELFASKLYLVDSHNKSAIYILNVTTGSLKTSTANTSVLGQVVATCLSSNNDGLYLLTSKPEVWFYRFDTDTLEQQTINLGSWPAGTAIASYSGNLYILADGTVYKHVRTLSGFGPKAEYLSSSTLAGLKNATAMAVDGNIYTLSSSGLYQYLAGALHQSLPVPSSLAKPIALHSFGGTLLMSVDSQSGRLGVWSTGNALKLDHQDELTGLSVRDAVYDPATKTDYAVTSDRVVSFTP